MLNTWQISINTFSGAHWIIKFSAQHKYNKKTSPFEDNQRGGDIPNKSIILGDFGEIPLVTTGDTAFSHLEWLLKCFNQNARDLNERYYNKKLCSARVVAENAYGMLKGRWQIIYKKCECKLYIKYVIMAVVLLHNISIRRNDPCKPRWRLSVDDIELIDTESDSTQPRNCQSKSIKEAHKISNWLWEQKVWLIIYL